MKKLIIETNNIQFKTRQRITDCGEVYSSVREVNAMLDLVKHETERIDSRFLNQHLQKIWNHKRRNCIYRIDGSPNGK